LTPPRRSPRRWETTWCWDLDGDDRIVGFEISGLSRKCGPNRNLSSLEIREPAGKEVG
jgi:hypothetical protein